MTAPLQFPSLQPPQAVASPSSLDGFAELLVNIKNHRQTIALERERLADQKKRTEAEIRSQANSDVANNAKTAAELRDKLKANAEHDQALQDADLGTEYAGNVFNMPGGATDANIQAARIKLIQGVPRKSVKTALAAFEAHIKDAADTRTATANARANTADANVAVNTEAARTAVGQGAPEVQKTQLREAHLRATMESMQLAGFDANRISAADALWQHSGKPWGAVRKQLGLPKIAGGLADDDTFAPKDTGTAAQRQAMGEGLSVANGALNALDNEGLSPAAFGVISSNPSGMLSGASTAAISGMLGDKQQHLVAAYAGFNAMTQAALPRGATSDKDAAEMRRAFVTLKSDAPSVKAQKALLRNAFVEAFQTATPGSHAKALENMLKIAKHFGVKDATLLAPFYGIRAKLGAADSAIKSGKSPDDLIIDAETRKP